MAPVKTKVTANTAAVNRLVEIITNLKTEIADMKDRIECCNCTILEQHKLLTSQNANIQAILRVMTGTNNHPELPHKSLAFQHVTLNESGPQGIVFLDEEQHVQSTITPPSLAVPMSPGVPAASEPEPKARRNRQRRDPTNSPLITADHHQSPEGQPPMPVQPVPVLQTVPRPQAAGLTVAPPAAAPIRNPSRSSSERGAAGLRAAGPRITKLHVFNLSEDTTPDDVIHHVQTRMGIPKPVCEQLVVTRGKYASFRLDVPTDNQKIVRDTSNWPAGVSVRLFNVVQAKNLPGNRITTKTK
jgi:hypothetical protein